MSKLGKVQARRAADLTEQLRLVLPPDTAGAAKSSP